MGWFWASSADDYAEQPMQMVPPKSGINGCISGTFWAPKAVIWVDKHSHTQTNDPPNANILTEHKGDISKCPVDHTKWNEIGKKGSDAKASTANAPIDAAAAPSVANSSPAGSAGDISKCPVDHTKFNQLNNMPHLQTAKAPGQKLDLPTERTMSSIPRGTQQIDGFWEYPSPQQMLNAMVRKSGPDGIEEDTVESMVDVHNFLNEGVWEEVLQWEQPHTLQSEIKPRLLKFQGRPGELSPRARILQALGWVYPSKFGLPTPFDRHDWTVLRAVPGKDNEWQQVRYIIDFYEIPEAEGEMPTFTVDVRPAADSLGNILDRAKVTWGPIVDKMMGWN